MWGMYPLMKSLSEYLNTENVTQKEFADMIGVKQSMVSKLASGKTKPGLALAVLIERKTGGVVSPKCWLEDAA